MDIQTKDGIMLRNVPDGTPDDVIKARIAQIREQNAKPAADPSEGGLQLRPFGINTGLTMPQELSRFAAGGGKALTDLWRGAAQRVGAGPSGQEMEQIKTQDAPLMNTWSGTAGNIAGNVLATLPTIGIPGVNSYTGAAALGAALGALQPTGENDSVLLNTVIGAGSGVAGQSLGNSLSRLVRPIQSGLNPEQARLAQVALDEGIPLNAADITGSKPLRIINSVLEHLPLTAGKAAALEASKSRAFNKAALSRAGITADLATPDVLLTRKTELGKTFENIAGRNKIRLFTPAEAPMSPVADWQAVTKAAPVYRGVAGQLDDIAREAQRKLHPADAERISNVVDNILSDVDKNGYMLGTNYQAWREPLRLQSKSGDALSLFMGKVRKTLDKAFLSQIKGADAEAWKQASREYANLKNIMDAMAGNAPNATSGNIAPAQLGMALARSIGKESKSLGRGDLNDLARAGNLFVRNQTPDSGTAQRHMIQSLLTGGSGAVAGGGIAAATGNDPTKGMMYGAGIGISSLLAPKLAQALLTNPNIEQYMINQAGSPTAKSLAQMIQSSGRTLGATAALPYMVQQ